MGLFDKFRKGLKKTRDEGITAQMDEVIESYEEITDELFDELEEIQYQRVAKRYPYKLVGVRKDILSGGDTVLIHRDIDEKPSHDMPLVGEKAEYYQSMYHPHQSDPRYLEDVGEVVIVTEPELVKNERQCKYPQCDHTHIRKHLKCDAEAVSDMAAERRACGVFYFFDTEQFVPVLSFRGKR